MRKEKAKHGSFWQMGTLPFVALWAGSYAASWLGLWLLLSALASAPFIDNDLIPFIAIAFISLVPALIQVQLVERLLKHRMRGWMLYALAGTLLTLITFTDSSPGSSRFALTMMSLFLPVALAQAVWLWRRVHAAWLWPLATVAAGLAFSVPLRSAEDSSTVIFILSGLLYGLVQGGIMRYLWLQPRETEKAKIQAAQTTQPIEDRSARLQDTTDTPAPWLSGDDQQAASSSR